MLREARSNVYSEILPKVLTKAFIKTFQNMVREVISNVSSEILPKISTKAFIKTFKNMVREVIYNVSSEILPKALTLDLKDGRKTLEGKTRGLTL